MKKKEKLKKIVNLNSNSKGVPMPIGFSRRIYPNNPNPANSINGGPSLCYYAELTNYIDEWNCEATADDGFDYVCDWMGKLPKWIDEVC